MEQTFNNLAEEVLMHHGVLGMKWGIRRYQNKDGSLTDKGKKHYAKGIERQLRKNEKRYIKERKKYQNDIRRANKIAKDSQSGFDDFNKMHDPYSIANKRKNNIRGIEAETKRLIKEANDLGYSVDTIPKNKYKLGGDVIADILLTGPVGAYALKNIKEGMDVGKSQRVTYNKYKVSTSSASDHREAIESIDRDIEFYKSRGDDTSKLETLKRKHEKELRKRT